MANKPTLETRREFLKNSLLLSGAVALTPYSAGAAGRKIENPGLQLYTLRKEATTDLAGTLEAVAGLGYQEMEFAGYYGRSPTQIRTLLENYGLTSPASHIQMAALRDNLQREIEAAATIGQVYIIVPIVAATERTIDHYYRHAEFLNQAGEACADAGLKIAYHNHDFEFNETNGEVPYDILLEQTDSGLVSFEMDLFWIINAGRDPVEYFNNHPGRFPAVHVKDRTAGGTMAAVGRGDINFAEILANADTAGIKHFFVEHDNPDDGFDSVAYSISTIQSLEF